MPMTDVHTPLFPPRFEITAVPDPMGFTSSSIKRRETAARVPETPNKRSRSATRARGSPSVLMLSPSPLERGRMDRILMPGSTPYFSTNFDKLATVGIGSSADVFKVRSHNDGGLYAIKSLTRESDTKRCAWRRPWDAC